MKQFLMVLVATFLSLAGCCGKNNGADNVITDLRATERTTFSEAYSNDVTIEFRNVLFKKNPSDYGELLNVWIPISWLLDNTVQLQVRVDPKLTHTALTVFRTSKEVRRVEDVRGYGSFTYPVLTIVWVSNEIEKSKWERWISKQISNYVEFEKRMQRREQDLREPHKVLPPTH